MPDITPMAPENQIVIQARTQTPSAEMLKKASETLRQARAGGETDPSPKEKASPETTPGTSDQPKDERILKARLLQEKMRRQLEVEKKQFAEEKRQLDLERANSRKWQEAAELAAQGRHIEAAEKAGITYDQLTQQILNGGNIPPARVAEQTATELVDKRFADFEKKREAREKAQGQQQYDQTLKQIHADVKYLVDSSDKFPLVKQGENYQDVVDRVVSEFHRTGRIIPVEEALNKVETEALEGLEELFKLESVRTRLHKEESPKPTKEEQVPQTLSQRATAPIPSPKGMTDAERKQRAIDAFYGRTLP